jgi:hypothetical protein
MGREGEAKEEMAFICRDVHDADELQAGAFVFSGL